MATCYDRYYNRYYTCRRSAWSNWGRWVALVVILIIAFLFFFMFSCLSARRRRKAGRTPFYGTGWTGRVPMNSNPAQYNPSYGQQQQAPPTYNSNVGYYGQNQTHQQGNGQRDTEMQRPDNTYSGGETVYAPPAGPPPGKHA